MVKNLSLYALQFWRYTMWKIGFLTSPEASHKQVFQVKQS
jgi:hypothetical protein